MAKTDMKLTTTDTMGNTNTATITYVNPNATSSQLVTLGRMITSLTSSAYNKTDRINTINCDTEEGGQKTQATITLATESMTLANLKTALKGANRISDITNISYNGDGILYAFISSDTVGFLGVGAAVGSGGIFAVRLFSASDTFVDQIVAPITITIRADETDNYTAAEATFTITA